MPGFNLNRLPFSYLLIKYKYTSCMRINTCSLASQLPIISRPACLCLRLLQKSPLFGCTTQNIEIKGINRHIQNTKILTFAQSEIDYVLGLYTWNIISQKILDKTIDYTLIICSTWAYLMKKHQNRPLNLPPRPQNNVESVRNENNKTTLIGGGMGEVCSM